MTTESVPRPWPLRVVAALLTRRAPRRRGWVPAAPSYLSYQVKIR